MLDIDVIHDPEAFAALRDAWHALFARAENPHFFQRFEWLHSAWTCVAAPKGRTLRIVVGRQDGRIVLIWPLTIHGKGLVRFLASDRGEYRDVLVEAGPLSAQWVAAAFDYLASMPDVDILHLQDIRPESPLKRHLDAHVSEARINVRHSPYIALRDWPDFATYFDSLSKKLKQNQKRQWRRLGDLGEVRFESITDPADAVDTIAWIYHRKRSWQASRGISSPSFSCAEYEKFIAESAVAVLEADLRHVCRLMVGDRIAAAGLGYVTAADYTFYMFAYDEDLETYSPGRLLMEKIVEWAMARRLSRFDLMASTLDYKHRWTEYHTDVSDYLVPCSRSGRIIVGWYSSVLRRRLLTFLWKHSPRQIFGETPRAIRRVASRALLLDWGDPYPDD